MIGIFSDRNQNYVFDCQIAFYLSYNYVNLFKVTQTRFLMLFEFFLHEIVFIHENCIISIFCRKFQIIFWTKLASSPKADWRMGGGGRILTRF